MREQSHHRRQRQRPNTRRLAVCILVAACVLVLLTRIVAPIEIGTSNGSTNRANHAIDLTRSQPGIAPIQTARPAAHPSSPEQIVARKLTQFAQSRREYAHELARRRGVPISA